MVERSFLRWRRLRTVSVLALSSRFDGLVIVNRKGQGVKVFQYSLCRVVLMVTPDAAATAAYKECFSTRSVESF